MWQGGRSQWFPTFGHRTQHLDPLHTTVLSATYYFSLNEFIIILFTRISDIDGKPVSLAVNRR